MKKDKTEKEKLLTLINQDGHLIHGVTSTINDLNESIPYLDFRLKENEALKKAISIVPDDLAEELLPIIFSPYERTHKELEKFQINLSSIGPIYPSTDGTASTFHSSINSAITDEEKQELWYTVFDGVFIELAEDNLQKELIQSNLAQINPHIAQLFSQVINTYQKAKLKLLGLDLAAIRMRDFVEKLWGEFVDIARQKDFDQKLKSRFELKVEHDRRKIGIIIALPGKQSLCCKHLDHLHNFHNKLSSPAKNPIFDDFLLLQDLFTEMILLTNALLSCIRVQEE